MRLDVCTRRLLSESSPRLLRLRRHSRAGHGHAAAHLRVGWPVLDSVVPRTYVIRFPTEHMVLFWRRRHMDKRGIQSLWWIAAIATLIVARPETVKADLMKIYSQPVQQTCVADGTTEYQMNVFADSTQADNKIRSAEWDVVVSPYFNITRAELPVVDEDFFKDFTMDPLYNRVDSSVSGGELTDNTRSVDNNDGPLKKIGKLGSYWFTIDENTPEGVYNFPMNGVYFDDTNFNTYDVMQGNLDIQANNFNIIPEPSTLASLILGIGVLLRRRW